jgi:hypothetical protein
VTSSSPVTHTDTRGSLTVEHLGVSCSSFVARGHLSEALARVIVVEGERIAREGHAVALHDWSALTGYDTAARHLCTAWMRTHRASFDDVTILVSSALVAMGVNVANIALGGFLYATTDRAAFDAAIARQRVRVDADSAVSFDRRRPPSS